MIITAQKNTDLITIGEGLTAKFSRPLKKTMVIEFRTPDQHKRNEIEKRRSIQNSVCWMICTDAARQKGETVDDMYFEFKYKHLAPVLAADDPEYAKFHEQMEMARTVIDPVFWRTVAGKAYTSHDSSVKQYASALTEFMNTLSRQSISYRHPEDYRRMLDDPFYQSLLN